MPVLMVVFVSLIGGFGIGAAVSNNQAAKEHKPKTSIRSQIKELPEVIQCGKFCGKNRAKSFDMITGECECIDSK